MQLKKFNPSSLKKIRNLGTGSYGHVRLFYYKEREQHVVGKVFLFHGDQESIQKLCADAKREAKILSRLKHENIVRVLGTLEQHDFSVTIVLEYAPCGNLENFLLNNIEIPLHWDIRARFFFELASALNYLHYGNPRISFQHGDLKSQNILLGDLLQIKLADFGATAASKRPGATSSSITADSNSQHTILYTAPEYLNNPNMQKTCSMDVYSYGMIGYEIITRKEVYSGPNKHSDLIKDWILRGEKPDLSCIDEVANNLEKNSSDSAILHELNKIVSQCWHTKAADRPKISDVKKRLSKLATKERIYSKKTNSKVEQLISSRKLNTQLPKCQKSKKFVRRWAALLLVAITAIVLAIIYDIANRQLNMKNAAVVFLSIDPKSLTKYEWYPGESKMNVNVTSLLRFPKAFEGNIFFVPDVVKVHDLVFVIGFSSTKNNLKVNLSESPLKWKEIEWKYKYKGRKYIAYKDSIFVAGMNYDHMRPIDTSEIIRNRYNKRSELQSHFHAYLFNTTTNEWTRLPNMKEPRVGHALVVFKDMVCAVGGSLTSLSNAECFNFSTNQWTLLPSMNTERRYSAAIELNDELYVIGGMDANDSMVGNFSMESDLEFLSHISINSVEKYRPEKKSWTVIDSLKHNRMCHGVGVFNKKIYVVGGYSDIVEVFDPSKKTWNIMDALLEHRLKFERFVAVEPKL